MSSSSMACSARRAPSLSFVRSRARLPFVAVAVSVVLSACAPKNLGIGSSQRLPEALPQHFEIPAQATSVFKAVEAEAERNKGCRVITKSARDLLISWCETVENWSDLGLDTVGADPKILGASHDQFQHFAQKPGKGIAIVTVWIEPLAEKSRVHLRRVTYGDESFAGMGHSRGSFERDFYTRIVRQLQPSRATSQ